MNSLNPNATRIHEEKPSSEMLNESEVQAAVHQPEFRMLAWWHSEKIIGMKEMSHHV